MLNLLHHPILAAFVFTLLATRALMPAAGRLGLIDVPGLHKTHRSATPLVGGIAMYFGFLVSYLIFGMATDNLSFSAASKFFVVGLVVILGAIDDRYALGVALRFRIQIVASLIMVWVLGVIIDSLGLIVPTVPLMLGWLALPFTVFAMVGAMNAMNMMDGLDGLAGGVALVTLVLLAALAAGSGRMVELHELSLLIGTLAAFLFFNVRWFGRQQALLFMGDAGSTFLGLTICYYLVELSQGDNAAIPPVVALWLFALPVCDTLSVMLRRLQSGGSPFKAGRDHFHHVLLAAGFSVNQTSLAIVALHAALCVFGIAGYFAGVPEAVLFWTFLTFALGYYWLLVGCEDPVIVVRRICIAAGRLLPFSQPILIMNVPLDLDTRALDRELRGYGVKAKIVLLRPAEAEQFGLNQRHVLIELDARISQAILQMILNRCGGETVPIAMRHFAARSPERDRRSRGIAGVAWQQRERRRRERRIPHFVEALASTDVG